MKAPVPTPWFTPARLEISRELGKETIQRLHRPSLIHDLWILVGWPAITIALVVAMARLPFGPLWIALFVLQGIRNTLYLEIIHDLFVHRRFGGVRFSTVAAAAYGLPTMSTAAGYKTFHLRHHHFLGTQRDPELPLSRLNTRRKRLWLLTYPGYANAYAGFWDRGVRFTPEFKRRLRFEARLSRAFKIGLVVVGVLWPPFGYGYVLPILLVSPAAAAVRVMLEHGEGDPTNPFYTGTFYRTSWLFNLLMPHCGDQHIAHHIFPGIPMYRYAEAARLIRPILLRHGVIERRSLLALLKGYFWDARPQWSVWRGPGGAPAAAPR